nr:putative ribonuclease H-like domain-containing protein [Tanacetum cinerariifolium]
MSPSNRSAGHRPHGASIRPPHRSAGHRPHGAPMRPSYKPTGHRPHGAPMRPSYKPTGHRPHGPSMNPMRPNMNVKTQYRAPWVPTVNRNHPHVNRKFSTGRRNFSTTNRKFPTASRKFPTGSTKIHTVDMGRKGKAVKPSTYWIWKPTQNLSNKGKGTIKTGKLKFENLYFVKDLKYNLFSVSQIYDNKNSVLFTDSECIVLGRGFKLVDDAN